MTRAHEEREHAASGVRFRFVGHLSWGPPEMANGIGSDVETWQCERCRALVPERRGDDTESAVHAEQHLAADGLVLVLEELRRQVAEIAPGAYQPKTPGVGTPDAQRTNDEARERRIATYRDAIEAGRAIRRDLAQLGLRGGGVHEAAAWSDSASVREVES